MFSIPGGAGLPATRRTRGEKTGMSGEGMVRGLAGGAAQRPHHRGSPLQCSAFVTHCGRTWSLVGICPIQVTISVEFATAHRAPLAPAPEDLPVPRTTVPTSAKAVRVLLTAAVVAAVGTVGIPARI